MSTPRILVLRTAGTNCDREAVHACELVGADVDLMHVGNLLDRPALLERYHLLLLPGGFSYGDDLGGGRILANEIRYRLGDAVRAFVADGKLVLGICNGFQVLVKAGLLPGGGDGSPTVTLAESGPKRVLGSIHVTFRVRHQAEDASRRVAKPGNAANRAVGVVRVGRGAPIVGHVAQDVSTALSDLVEDGVVPGHELAFRMGHR